ncbi:MAG: hypothetical protein QGG42_00165 [Phycisphaerae bacterium]|jgi:hypothetical protein|nr:hypothetical protein [Phycisphaerae bacterium]
MRQNISSRQRGFSAAALTCLVLGLLVLAGCFNPRADIRIPDIPPIPAIPDANRRATVTELGYGTVVTTEGRRVIGWWRIDSPSQTYQRHEPPTTRSGRPSGYERTLEAIPEKRVVGFKLK